MVAPESDPGLWALVRALPPRQRTAVGAPVRRRSHPRRDRTCDARAPWNRRIDARRRPPQPARASRPRRSRTMDELDARRRAARLRRPRRRSRPIAFTPVRPIVAPPPHAHGRHRSRPPWLLRPSASAVAAAPATAASASTPSRPAAPAAFRPRAQPRRRVRAPRRSQRRTPVPAATRVRRCRSRLARRRVVSGALRPGTDGGRTWTTQLRFPSATRQRVVAVDDHVAHAMVTYCCDNPRSQLLRTIGNCPLEGRSGSRFSAPIALVSFIDRSHG